MANLFTRNTIWLDSGASSRKKGGDPICPSVWTADRSKKVEKKDHPTELNALARSILNIILGSFRLYNDLVVLKTYLKLS
jgi:hypothetical protein